MSHTIFLGQRRYKVWRSINLPILKAPFTLLLLWATRFRPWHSILLVDKIVDVDTSRFDKNKTGQSPRAQLEESFQALKADPVPARSDKSPSERDHARYPRDAASHEWHDVNVGIWPWRLARKVRSNMKINKRDCVASSRSSSSRVISVRRARWTILSLSSHYIIIFIMSNYIHWFFKFELFY